MRFSRASSPAREARALFTRSWGSHTREQSTKASACYACHCRCSMRRMLSAAAMVAQLGAGSGGGTGPVSPSVLATTMYVMTEPGRGELELMVLWRGAPGWFMRGGGQTSGGSSGGGGGTDGAGREAVRTQWISQGGVTLNLRFEPKSRRLWILDQD